MQKQLMSCIRTLGQRHSAHKLPSTGAIRDRVRQRSYRTRAAAGAAMVVDTPGRVVDLMEEGACDSRRYVEFILYLLEYN